MSSDNNSLCNNKDCSSKDCSSDHKEPTNKHDNSSNKNTSDSNKCNCSEEQLKNSECSCSSVDSTMNSCTCPSSFQKDSTACTCPSLTIPTDLTTKVPESEIKIKKFDDGFSLEVKHSHTSQKKGSYYESNYSFYKEEHFGRPVNDVKGMFNDSGNYEIKVDFGDH